MTALAPDADAWGASVPACEFGICRREAEHQVLVEAADGSLEHALFACWYHITPAVVWGRPEPLEVVIRPVPA